MKTRILHTKFWDDNFVSELSPEEKLVYLYYLTNEKIGLTGAYECSDRVAIFATGVDKKVLLETKQRLSSKGKVIFDGDWVLIVNAQKYSNYTSNDKMKKAYTRERDMVPEPLRNRIKEHSPGVVDTSMILVSGYPDTSLNQKPEIINDKPESRNQKSKWDGKTLPTPNMFYTTDDFHLAYENYQSTLKEKK